MGMARLGVSRPEKRARIRQPRRWPGPQAAQLRALAVRCASAQETDAPRARARRGQSPHRPPRALARPRSFLREAFSDPKALIYQIAV